MEKARRPEQSLVVTSSCCRMLYSTIHCALHPDMLVALHAKMSCMTCGLVISRALPSSFPSSIKCLPSRSPLSPGIDPASCPSSEQLRCPCSLSVKF
eukprot:753919-Hanusia_phi.AAC.2